MQFKSLTGKQNSQIKESCLPSGKMLVANCECGRIICPASLVEAGVKNVNLTAANRQTLMECDALKTRA